MISDTEAHASLEHSLEARITTIGGRLGRSFSVILSSVPGGPYGPVDLGKRLGVDKVLASRIIKACRNHDPMAVVHLTPGPEPLRRLLDAVAKLNVQKDLIIEARAAVDDFEQLIRGEIGDRSSLDAIISSWLPEARQEFELRRKQSAFKAISQLKGAMAETNMATVILHPSNDQENLDVLWLSGLFGLQRLRPGAGVKVSTRRFIEAGEPRHPVTLDGESVDSVEGLRLDAFCSDPPPRLDVHQMGEVVHYTLAEQGFGPRSAVDLVFAEMNEREMPRYVPKAKQRKGYVFAEVATPVKVLQFDVLLHEDVYPGSEPALVIYDTAFDGVADANNPSRDLDRLDLAETVAQLGNGTARFRTTDVPRYAELLAHVCTKRGWNGIAFRGYRCRIDYPVYGSQVTLAFDPPAPPSG